MNQIQLMFTKYSLVVGSLRVAPFYDMCQFPNPSFIMSHGCKFTRTKMHVE